MDRFLQKAKDFIDDIKGDDDNNEQQQQQQQQSQYQQQQQQSYQQNEGGGGGGGGTGNPNLPEVTPVNTNHRFQSFSPQTTGGAKWYVDGASYFWAVSIALEEARESIYILDWWLSPELYLRRPPARNEQYRLDNMLRAAAERGVEVRIIVYKEVTQALTLDSAHTKHALEALHPNIRVFRHPDHLPTDRPKLEQAFAGLSLENLKMNAFSLSKVSGDTLKELYGSLGDTVLFWAHHEKLCVVDRRIVFMGGLDMCFGRYDTNSHPIADAHPGNLDAIIFPGQDFNNARVFDFEGVENWDHNQLERTSNSRMGWSDVALSLNGPIVSSLLDHFTDRWNFIFDEKYTLKDEGKYQRMEAPRGGEERHHLGELQGRFHRGVQHLRGEEEGGNGYEGERRRQGESGGINIQLCRSACDWSSGHPHERSIFNAYVHAIEDAEHFVYIENQFFITATSDEQQPVMNKIGASIVSRILRAHRNGEEFRVVVLMPAVPAFAGDLHSDGALGTRAIMEFQYNSINRGGHSIIESLQQGGVDDWRRYIGFYNLRNYDRINISSTLGEVERESGVPYEDARQDYENRVNRGEGEYGSRGGDQYDRYQSATSRVSDDQTWDTVSSCYMEGGMDLREVPWHGDEQAEFNAFVSEELYIHTKVLIADDRLVICGSANLNDRSQLGNHDSEIAVVIEDPDMVESTMNGRQYSVSRFATSLRRTLFRKHLGLLPDQRWDRPNANWTPLDRDPQEYDWGSRSDRVVEDPLGDEFSRYWSDTARSNTEIFSKVFHNVPNDACRTWENYDDFFTRHFIVPAAADKEPQEAREEEERQRQEGKVDYGHVVREEFRDGGVREVKEWLARVRGTLVDMPLDFLIEVADIAKEGLSLNAFTDEIYT